MSEANWPATRAGWERTKRAWTDLWALLRAHRAVTLIGKSLDADAETSIAHMRELVECYDALRSEQPDTGGKG